MAGNHVEAHLSLRAISSIGRRKNSLTQHPRLVPTPKKRATLIPTQIAKTVGWTLVRLTWRIEVHPTLDVDPMLAV